MQEISGELIDQTLGFGDLMLPNDDPRVEAALSKLQERAMTEDAVKESLTKGTSWPTGHKQHQEAREQLAQRFGAQAGHTCHILLNFTWSLSQILIFIVIVTASRIKSTTCVIISESRYCSAKVPSGPELFDKFATVWSRVLPPREQDLLYLHQWTRLGLAQLGRLFV